MTNPNGHYSGDNISAITWCCYLKFLHSLQTDPGYLAHPQRGRGSQKIFNREYLKFGLKLSVWALITSGLVGISSTKLSRRRGERWSTNERGMGTNIDTTDLLVYCKLTQFHMPRGCRARFSGSFGRWRCCRRNIEYLNWLSTWNCGTGRPHVWLCHALLVIIIMIIVIVISNIIMSTTVPQHAWNTVTIYSFSYSVTSMTTSLSVTLLSCIFSRPNDGLEW